MEPASIIRLRKCICPHRRFGWLLIVVILVCRHLRTLGVASSPAILFGDHGYHNQSSVGQPADTVFQGQSTVNGILDWLMEIMSWNSNNYYNDVFGVAIQPTEYNQSQSKAIPLESIRDSITTLPDQVHLHSNAGQGKFAYASVIAGCDNHDSCVGYILNTLVASSILRYHNSTADFVLLIRMANSTHETRLSVTQEQWLSKAGVKLVYVPKTTTDNYPTAMLEKFRVLELLQYDRVRFLDADLIPMCNLDREFQDSYEGRLQGFVGKRGGLAPITGCDFMVTPQRGLFERTMNLIHEARQRNNGKWDPKVGFGHRFRPGERWVAGSRIGVAWDFYGATVDQGLLYQLFRYEIGNWSDISGGRHLAWEETDKAPPAGLDFTNPSWVPLSNGHWATIRNNLGPWKGAVCFTRNGKRPLNSIHFYGANKPWRHDITLDTIPQGLEERKNVTQTDVWFYWLGMANRTLDLHLPSVIRYGGEREKKTKAKHGNPMQYDKNPDVLLAWDTEIPRPFLEDSFITT